MHVFQFLYRPETECRPNHSALKPKAGQDLSLRAKGQIKIMLLFRCSGEIENIAMCLLK